MDLKIPTSNHGRLLVPDYAEVPKAIEDNEKLFANTDIRVGDVPIAEFRTMVRKRLESMLGLGSSIDRPIFLTAHQPGLWHPGILYKVAVAKKFSGTYFLLSLNVDSDVVSPVSFRIPHAVEAGMHCDNYVLISNREQRVIERLGKPPKEEMDALFADVQGKIETVPASAVHESFRRFLDIHDKQYEESDTFSHWLTNCRKAYYPVPGLHEMDISQLCGTEEFRLFAWDIISNCKKFFEIYNSCLDTYRREHNIRTAANPFPDLEQRGRNHIELPFWLVNADGGREHTFVACTEKTILATDKEVLIETTSRDSGPRILQNYEIRPKAVLLTMFMRMFVGSIFIHGTGGGSYDEVTDCVIREYCGCEPPKFIIGTRTEYIPLNSGADIGDRLDAAKQELRNMTFNPDQYVDPGNTLAGEKKRILARDRSDTTKEEYRRLKEIRDTLVKEIKDRVDAKEREVMLLEEEADKVAGVMRRDLPYFFYPVEQMED